MSRIIILLLFVTVLASSVSKVITFRRTSLATDAEVATMISKGEQVVKDGDIIARDMKIH
jgi:hypothetical protein